jgi:tetratricopeptide (TPR) repeat protein
MSRDESLVSESRPSRFERGLELVQSKLFSEALGYFDQALLHEHFQSSRIKSQCHYWLGECYFASELFESALLHYSLAIDLDSTNSQVFFDRGYLESRLKHHSNAIRDFDQCILLNAEYSWAYFHRGWNQFHLAAYEEAIQDFRKALELGTGDLILAAREWLCSSLKAISKFWLRNGNLELVVSYLEELVQLQDFCNLKYLQMLSGVYSDLRRHEEANEILTRIIDLDPRNSASFAHRAYSFYKMKLFDYALKDYQTALELNPNSEDALMGIEKVMAGKLKLQQKILQSIPKAKVVDAA